VNPTLLNTIIFTGQSNWAREMENTDDPDLIYIARNGHIIGRYYPQGILKGFGCGFFLPGDLGWERELGTWLLLTEIINVPVTSGTADVSVAPSTPEEAQSLLTSSLTPNLSQELALSLEPEVVR
jgi:hypothetical protein